MLKIEETEGEFLSVIACQTNLPHMATYHHCSVSSARVEQALDCLTGYLWILKIEESEGEFCSVIACQCHCMSNQRSTHGHLPLLFFLFDTGGATDLVASWEAIAIVFLLGLLGVLFLFLMM